MVLFRAAYDAGVTHGFDEDGGGFGGRGGHGFRSSADDEEMLFRAHQMFNAFFNDR